jgi:hypothetical protein
MRIKFEATDATGKVHKRGSKSQAYSHCVVIHFAENLPSRLARGYRGLQPRRVGGKPCAGRTHCQPLAQETLCRGHRDPRGEASAPCAE